MRLLASGLLLAALLACDRASRQGDAEVPYSFTTIEYPGATRTMAADIDDHDRVVGSFAIADTVRGYIYANGEFTVIQYPGAIATQVTSIASDGSLSGAYRKPGEPGFAWYGFVRRPSGEFVDVRYPGHPHSMVQRVLDDGTLIGCFHGSDLQGSMFGMVGREENLIATQTPGSMNNGATPDGRRVVGVLSMARRGFVAEGDRVTHLEAPGSTATETWDINAAGMIVGAHIDSADVPRAYLLENGQWRTLEVPAAVQSVAFGINSRGDIAGGWQDSTGVRRAFIARRSSRRS